MLFIIFILLSLIFYSALHYRPHLISLGNFKFAKYSKIQNPLRLGEEKRTRARISRRGVGQARKG